MKRYTSITLFVALLFALGAAGTAQAQATKYAQAGMGFLKIDPDPRVAAMGGTYAGNIGSATAVFANPAALSMLEGFDATASVTSWIADISLYGAAVAYRFGNIGTFGLSLVSMDYGDFRRTIPYTGTDPALRNQGYIDQGTFSVNEYAVGLSYARQITSQFYVGGTVRMASQDLGNVEIINELTGNIEETGNSLNNVVLDFGTMYYTGYRDLRFGVSVRNFSNQSDYFDQRFELPLTLDFGMAMDVLSLAGGEVENSALTLAVDWLHPRDFEERLHVGAEYAFMDMAYLRGGYKFNYDEEGLTGGLGVHLKTGGYGLKADYSYSAFGDFFGAVHRIGVGITLQ